MSDPTPLDPRERRRQEAASRRMWDDLVRAELAAERAAELERQRVARAQWSAATPAPPTHPGPTYSPPPAPVPGPPLGTYGPAYAPPVDPSPYGYAPVGYAPGFAPPRPRRFSRSTKLWLIAFVLTVCLAVLGAFDGIASGPLADRIPQGTPHYAFLNTTPDGRPVTYASCQPIHYQVNTAGAPANWRDFVDGAIAQASEASGFRFVFDGTTPRRVQSRMLLSYAARLPVLIEFASPAEEPELAGDVIGFGGSRVLPSSTGGEVLGAGEVALEQEGFADLSARHDTAEEQAIVMHELGHVLGLDHVDDSGELMDGKNNGRTTWGDGDRIGLRLLGPGDKC